jgi:hypothetical protein
MLGAILFAQLDFVHHSLLQLPRNFLCDFDVFGLGGFVAPGP